MRLLEPARVGALTLQNRIVMAPLTRNRARGAVANELMATYYSQRATAGLIIAEAAQVSPQGQSYPDTPGLHTAEQIEGWRLVTRAVHEAGGRIVVQLFHGGRISHPLLLNGRRPVAPSAIRPAGSIVTPQGPRPFETPRALELDEIPEIVEQFRRAVVNAREAGFDGVEIHGANGYLLDQFLQSGTNHRTDAYGGPVQCRLRLLLEVTRAAAEAWEPGRVGVRLSPPGGKFNDMADEDPVATMAEAARALAALNLAYLHVIEAAPGDGMAWRDGRSIGATEILRQVHPGTLITNGGYNRECAEAALEAEIADLVSFGRLYIANPDLVERFALNAPLNQPDRSTFYSGGERGYVDYPTLATATA